MTEFLAAVIFVIALVLLAVLLGVVSLDQIQHAMDCAQNVALCQ